MVAVSETFFIYQQAGYAFFLSDLQYACAGFIANDQCHFNRRHSREMINDLLCIGTGAGCKNGEVDRVAGMAASAESFYDLLNIFFKEGELPQRDTDQKYRKRPKYTDKNDINPDPNRAFLQVHQQ